jgi:hypothetical protein
MDARHEIGVGKVPLLEQHGMPRRFEDRADLGGEGGVRPPALPAVSRRERFLR